MQLDFFFSDQVQEGPSFYLVSLSSKYLAKTLDIETRNSRVERNSRIRICISVGHVPTPQSHPVELNNSRAVPKRF